MTTTFAADHVRTSPGARQRIEHRTVHVLSPGAIYQPDWTTTVVKVHTANLTYTEHGAQGVLAHLQGHRVLTTGELSKVTNLSDPVPADWPNWLRQAAQDYAPEWFITPAWLERDET